MTPIAVVESAEASRIATGLGEVDRVLGGGFVPGSIALFGGDPGIGKSTLLLQVAGLLAARGLPVLYLTGEESPGQVRGRAERVGAVVDGLQLAATTRTASPTDPRDRPRRAARRPTWAVDSSPVAYSTPSPVAATPAATWRRSVDLPIPGSPPKRAIEPGTKPPPRTRSTSPMPDVSRARSALSTIAIGTTEAAPAIARAADGARVVERGAATVSTIVFHAPHDGH